MKIIELLRLASDNILANKLRSFLTTLGVIIGVMSVIMLVSIGEGARKYLADAFAGLGTNLLIVTPGKRETKGPGPPTGGTRYKLTLDDARAIQRRAYEVSGVAPAVLGAGTIKFRNRQRDTTILGVGEDFPRVRHLDVNIGTFFTESDVDASRRIAVIGRTVQRELFGDEGALGESIKVAGARFKIVGILEQKGNTLGLDIDDIVFLPVSTAQDMFNFEHVNQILVQAANKGNVSPAVEEIRRILIRRHGGEEDFTITSQEDILGTFNDIANTMTYFLLGIASISLIVGGIGIMNIMLVSVRERTREIGLRKAVGATNRDILFQFLVESIAVSLLGGTTGLILGVTVSLAVKRFVPDVPVEITPWILVMAFSFSVAVGVFFGVVPAQRAAELNPIEALRYE